MPLFIRHCLRHYADELPLILISHYVADVFADMDITFEPGSRLPVYFRHISAAAFTAALITELFTLLIRRFSDEAFI